MFYVLLKKLIKEKSLKEQHLFKIEICKKKKDWSNNAKKSALITGINYI